MDATGTRHGGAAADAVEGDADGVELPGKLLHSSDAAVGEKRGTEEVIDARGGEAAAASRW